MKTLLMAALVAALSLASHSANAQEYAGQRYLGFNIGQTKVDYCDSSSTTTLTNCSDKDTSIKLYVGHNLQKNFAVEAGFIDFGEFKLPNYTFFAFGNKDSLSVKSSGNSLFVAGMGKSMSIPK